MLGDEDYYKGVNVVEPKRKREGVNIQSNIPESVLRERETGLKP